MDEITPDLLKRTLRAFRHNQKPPPDLFNLRLLAKLSSSSRTEQEIQLRDLLYSIAWKELVHRRRFAGLPHTDEPSSKQVLIQALLADFRQEDKDLEAWSALYHRFLSPIHLSEEELARQLPGSNKDMTRQFRRRVDKGIELLVATLHQAEEKLIGETWPSHNLPAELDQFIGRVKETAEIKQRLFKFRLLTLTGTAGCGKTRLALRVAHDLKDEFEDGVWLVELGSLRDEELVLQATASVLAVRQEDNRSLIDTVIDFSRLKRLLLVLDNCEHLIEACTQLVDAMLRNCPHVHILATSRERLGIKGEALFLVRPLNVPDPNQPALPEKLTQYEAVQLFVERARAKQTNFELTNQYAPAVAKICIQLDGLPLAIELAAARVGELSVRQIAALLDDRFRFLTRGNRTSPPRHQTLQASIDWSYDLLSETDRVLLRRLSVFAGGWELEEAEAISTGDGLERSIILNLLSSLLYKSLVVAEPRGEEMRYRMLETIRDYARNKLRESGEEAELCTRHRDWYLELAERAERELQGPNVKLWLDQLEQEHDNLRAALKWCREDTTGEARLRLAGALWQFWEERGYLSEGLSWLEEALSVSGSLKAEASRDLATWRARALRGAGSLAYDLGQIAQAEAWFREGLDLCRAVEDKRGAAYAHIDLGAVMVSDYAQAKRLYEEARTLFNEAEDKVGIAFSLSRLGDLASRQGNYKEASTLYEQALALQREAGNKRGMAWSLSTFGKVARDHLGDYDRAVELFAESRDVFYELGNKPGFVYSTLGVGRSALYQDDCNRARACFEESQTLFQNIGDKRGLAISLMGMGEVAYYCRRNLLEAEEYYKQSLDLYREVGNEYGIAWSLSDLADAEFALSNYEQAKAWQQDSLVIRQKIKDSDGIAYSLEGLAYVAGAQGLLEKAARLLGASESLRETAGIPLPTIVCTYYKSHVDSIRAQLGEAAFATMRVEGRAMTPEQAVAYVLDKPNGGSPNTL